MIGMILRRYVSLLYSMFLYIVMLQGTVHASSFMQTVIMRPLMQSTVAHEGICPFTVTRDIQETLWQVMFHQIKTQALAYCPRGRSDDSDDIVQMQDTQTYGNHELLSSSRLKQWLYLLALSSFFSFKCFAMDAYYRPITPVLSGYTNARPYAEASCFPCGGKKKPRELTREELDAHISKKLLDAVRTGNRKDVFFNAFHGNIVNMRDDQGLAPLHYAVQALYVKTTEQLLRVPHIDLNLETPEGFTALQLVELRKKQTDNDEECARCDAISLLIRECEYKRNPSYQENMKNLQILNDNHVRRLYILHKNRKARKNTAANRGIQNSNNDKQKEEAGLIDL